MGSLGLVAIFIYVFYYWRCLCIVLRRDTFHRFMLLGFITFELYAMTDTATFVPIPTMLIGVLLTLIIESPTALYLRVQHLLSEDCFFKSVYGKAVENLKKVRRFQKTWEIFCNNPQ
jgi:hypothetical protein